MKKEMNEYFKLLSKYLKPLKGNVILLGIVLGVGIGLQLIIPQITGYFIDSARDAKPIKTLMFAAASFIGIAIIQQVLALVSTYMTQVIGWSATNQLRLDLIEKCLSLDMTFHKKYKQGEMIERIDGDVSDLFNFFSNLMIKLINNVLLIVGIVVILFITEIRVGLCIAVLIIIAVSLFSNIQKRATPLWKENRQVTSEFYGMIGESVDSIEDIRTSKAMGYFMDSYYKFLKRHYKIMRRAFMKYWEMMSSSIFIFACMEAVALGLGGYLWSEGIIRVGQVYTIFHYMNILTRPLNQLRSQLEDLQKGSASIQRIEELFATESQLKDGELSENFKDGLGININDISFHYEDGENVLKDISLDLPQGKILGILGRTGSGKTTLARLIARLYEPQKGDIRFNNIDINSIKIENLRKSIAYVTQDVQIFCGTVRDNITLFNSEIEDEKIIEIIDYMGLNDWLNKLPEGLDTELQSDGGGLSAGEAQLLAFIRVFLKEPSLVIMDEASSRLDPITEGLMEKALQKLLENRTCIIIAHRLETLNRAHKILILEEGRIIESGNREKLAKDETSRFHMLLTKGIEEVLV